MLLCVVALPCRAQDYEAVFVIVLVYLKEYLFTICLEYGSDAAVFGNVVQLFGDYLLIPFRGVVGNEYP